MAWNTPVTTFSATDGLTNTHMNEIGENLGILHSGNGQNSVSNLAIAENLPIGVTDHFCYVSTGASYIWRLQYTDGTTTRLNGNIFWIYFANGTTVGSGHGTSGNYYEINTPDGIVNTFSEIE